MGSLTDVVSGSLGKALEEADKLLQSPRARVEIIALNRQMRTVTSELGKRTLQLYRDGRIQDPELAELCARIISIEARIAEREARLAQLQQSKVASQAAAGAEACSRCNSALPQDAAFCPACGLRVGVASPPSTSQGLFCGQCGRELRPEARFCPRCGSSAQSA